MESLKGKIVGGNYKLLRMIGEGGMGSVWEAEHTTILRRFAVKVMHNLEGEKRGLKLRLFREAQAASSIGHPNIIQIFDVGVEDDGIAFIVMELLEGTSLVDMIDTQGKLPALRVVNIVLQLLSALHAAHDKGIVHRDIKPDNIFITVDDRGREDVKLLDFGIAKILDEVPESVKLTQSGTVLGTPCYLSPEQAAGRSDVDERVDIWAIGVMMYEMLSGRTPYSGENYNEVLCNILTNEAPPVGEVVYGVPLVLAAIIKKAMTKDRDERYSKVSHLMRDLMPIAENFDEYMGTASARAVRDSALLSIEGAPKFVTTGEEPTEKYPDIEAFSAEPVLPPNKKVSGSRRGFFAGLGITLIVGLTAMVVLFGGEGETEPKIQKANPASSIHHQAGGQADNRASGSQTSLANAQEPSQELSAMDSGDKSSGETVTIQLSNLPPRAKVYLDQRKVSPPIELPASSNPTTMRVTCPGYRPFRKRLTPDRDLTVDVKMNRISSRRASSKNQRRGSTRKWRNNPFQ